MIFLSSWTSSRIKYLSLVLLLVALAPIPASGSISLGYVIDTARVIDEGVKSRLISRLQELEEKTGAQMVVLVVDSTEGAPIEEYSLQKAELWKLGQKGKDNGLLFVIAMKDRRYRIETGYGLEGILPDSLAGSIARQRLVPLFRQGRFSEGIEAAVTDITDIIARSHGVELGRVPPAAPAQKEKGGGPLVKGVLAVVFFLFMLASGFFRRYSPRDRRFRHPGRYYAGGFPMAGGGFGGGFGSFGGRGGGFGGGGVSGGW